MDIDQILGKEASELSRDQEVERILNEFQLDAYSVLDLQPGCSKTDITKQYRKKSLLIHPDKTKNVRAPDAFDRLKKAEAALQDDTQRAALDEAFTEARILLIKERKWKMSDERLKSPEFLRDWRQATREVLVENELRKRRSEQLRREEEGRLNKKIEEELNEKKLQRQAAKEWENSRDDRVSNWRDYQSKVTKKTTRKKKQAVLG